MSDYIIQTSKTRRLSLARNWRPRDIRRVAVLEVVPGTKEARIDSRDKRVIRVVQVWENCYVGKTTRSSYYVALREAEELIQELGCESE